MNSHAPLRNRRRVLVTTLAVGMIALSPALRAQTWNGSVDTNWNTAGNWTPSGVPSEDNGAVIVINAGTVQYDGTVNGDLTLGNGGSITLNGGTFTQTNGVAFMNIGNGVGSAGTLTITGGTFSAGTSGNMRIGFGGGTGLVSVTGGVFNPTALEFSSTGTLSIGGSGTANISGNFAVSTGAVAVSGGTVNISGELKPLGADFSVSGGAINANLISFDGLATKLNFSGGQITIASGAFGGIFGDNGYINFTNGSTGTIVFSAVSADSATALLNSRLRFNDTVDGSKFVITDLGGGASSVSLVAVAVPEPSSYAVLAGAAMFGIAASRRRRD